MAEAFPILLVTPTGIAYEGDVEEIIAWNSMGQFGVLAKHIDFVTSLVPEVVEITLAGGETRYYVVSGGLAEVKNGKMTILADSAEKPDSIALPKVEELLRELEARVAALSMYAPEFETAHYELMLARARHRAAAELRPAR